MDAATKKRTVKRGTRTVLDKIGPPQSAAHVADQAKIRQIFGRWGAAALLALAAGLLDVAKGKLG